MKTQKFNFIALMLIVLSFVLTSSKIPSENYHNIKSGNFATGSYFSEETLEIELWMFNDQFWKLDYENIILKDDAVKEDDFEIENWMISEQFWSYKKGNSVDVAKGEIDFNIADWMIDDEIWKF